VVFNKDSSFQITENQTKKEKKVLLVLDRCWKKRGKRRSKVQNIAQEHSFS